MRTRSTIEMPCIANTGAFARYQRFSDERQVIVRRGTKLGHNYGLQHPDERHVVISGIEVTITRHSQILSPPVLEPGSQPITPKAARRYRPEYDVVRLPGAEVMIQRSPEGFTDDDVAQIIATITLTPQATCRRASGRPPSSPPRVPTRFGSPASATATARAGIGLGGPHPGLTTVGALAGLPRPQSIPNPTACLDGVDPRGTLWSLA